MDYLSFKSGTDIRGIACEGVQGEHINLTDEAVAAMTAGFLCWFEKRADKPLDNCTKHQ